MIFLILSSLQLSAQEADYAYFKINPEITSYLNTAISSKIEGYEGERSKQNKEYWEKSKENFIENIEDSVFIYSKQIDERVSNILGEIYQSNPNIDHSNFRFFVRTSPLPNASSYGNGIFSINNGLFSLTENDDEIAFILCHEIAHYELQHIDKSIETYFQETESGDAKDRISKIKEKRYGRFALAREFYQDLSFLMRKNSREAEIEADSLGNIYYSKTSYSPAAAIAILSRLDFDERSYFNKKIDLKKYFSFEEYPFKNYWIEKEETNLFNIDKPINEYAFNADSIKTHPAIKERVKILKAQSPEDKEVTVMDSKDLRKISILTAIEIALDKKQLDLALYFLINEFESNNIDRQHFATKTAALFKELYVLKDSHQIGRYISPENPFSKEEELDKIRRFLINLEMKNTRKIGYFFAHENETSLSANAGGRELLAYFNNINSN